MNDQAPDYRRDGNVLLDDKSLWAGDQDLLELRRRVGMLFQRPNPFPMSIKDNVNAGVKAHRIAKGKQLDVVCENAAATGGPVGCREGPVGGLTVPTFRGTAAAPVSGPSPRRGA